MGPLKTYKYIGIEELYDDEKINVFLDELNKHKTDSGPKWVREQVTAGDPQTNSNVVRRFAIAEKIIDLNSNEVKIEIQNKTIRCIFEQLILRIHYIATMTATFKIRVYFDDFDDEANLSDPLLLQELEEKLTTQMKQNYLKQIAQYVHDFRETTKEINTITVLRDKDESDKVDFTWVHTFLGFNFKDKDINQSEIANDLAIALKQKPENMNDLDDRYVFLGWFRSIYLTNNLDWPLRATYESKNDMQSKTVETIYEYNRPTIDGVARIVQYTQYLYHSLLLIDKTLFDKFIAKKNTQKQESLDQQNTQKSLDQQINELEDLRNRINKFLDQFSFSPNITWNAEAKILFEELRKMWRLPEYGDAIKNMLKQINAELKDMQEESRRHRDNRLNNLVMFFTFLTITAVIIEFWALDKKIQDTGTFTVNAILVVVITTLAVILVSLITFKVLPEEKWKIWKIISGKK